MSLCHPWQFLIVPSRLRAPPCSRVWAWCVEGMSHGVWCHAAVLCLFLKDCGWGWGEGGRNGVYPWKVRTVGLSTVKLCGLFLWMGAATPGSFQRADLVLICVAMSGM